MPKTFEKIKIYLIMLPILVPLVHEKPLLLYITTTDIMGALFTLYL